MTTENQARETRGTAPHAKGPLCDNCGKTSREHYCYTIPSDETYHPSESSPGTHPPQEGWISVEERLPEFDHVVLAYCTDARGTSFIEAMTCGQFEGTIEWYEQDGDFWGGEITHWQPLPQPPCAPSAPAKEQE